MQTLIGRLTADAKIAELQDGRKVIHFTIACNDRIKTKKADEAKEIVTFFACSYWKSTAIAPYLKKGSLVEASGRIDANAWINMEGNAVAQLTLHVNYVKLHGKAPSQTKVPIEKVVTPDEPLDDLPF